MQDTTSHVDELEVFATAVRAVLTEMEYDGHLAIPSRIAPTDSGVLLQVSEDEFPAWCEVLAGCSTEVTAEPHHVDSLGLVDHVTATGTINCHHVQVVTVRRLDAGSAVA